MERQAERYRDGEARLPESENQDARQRQLTRLGNAAGGAGLSELMAGDTAAAAKWLSASELPACISAVPSSRSTT